MFSLKADLQILFGRTTPQGNFNSLFKYSILNQLFFKDNVQLMNGIKKIRPSGAGFAEARREIWDS
jgi:hypothetical protein